MDPFAIRPDRPSLIQVDADRASVAPARPDELAKFGLVLDSRRDVLDIWRLALLTLDGPPDRFSGPHREIA